MATKYTKNTSGSRRATKALQKATPQMQKTPGLQNEAKNNAGGYVFKVNSFEQLKRFLILGSEGGSYYVGEQKLTQDNAKNTIACIKENGVEAVKQIVEISKAGRAPKNDPAIFALALAVTYGDAATKQAAYAAIPQVCRTGTMIFQFAESVQDLRGWSRGLRKGVGKFYTGAADDKLALQLVKYRQRNGWTHKDVLRLTHIKPTSLTQAEMLRWAVGKDVKVQHPLIQAFEVAQKLTKTDEDQAVKLISEAGLPWEALPTQLLGSKKVWESLLYTGMGMTALLRNLGKMTSIGLLDSNMSAATKKVVEQFGNVDQLKKSRLHPLQILVALKTYQQGHGTKGDLSWTPVKKVVDALDDAFYTAFAAAPVTGKNYLLACDCSGSMGSQFGGSPLTSVEAAGAMAMITLKNEPWCEPVFFSSGSYSSKWSGSHSINSGIGKLDISGKSKLSDVVQTMLASNWGGTDCSLPMLYAAKEKLEVDVFVVYTDNETWAGAMKPFQALKKYRQKMGRDAKLAVVATSATPFTIADPDDKGMLDFVGFDTSVPSVLASFALGEV